MGLVPYFTFDMPFIVANISSILMIPSDLCSMLAEKLNMTPEAAEKWIVNLIRNARLDAKIDSKEVMLILVFLIYIFLFIIEEIVIFTI